jgi:MSHA pilin protein MshC
VKRSQGFTLIELIAVMVVIGVLAGIGIPRLVNGNDSAAMVFGDSLVSALRLAQKNAVARRRLVCASASGSAVVLRVASLPAALTCDAVIAGIGDDDFRTSSTGVTGNGLAGAGSVLFFQPDGTISLDARGKLPAQGSAGIVADGLATRTIQIMGTTGYVE